MLEGYPRLPGEPFLEYCHRLLRSSGGYKLQEVLDVVDNFGTVPETKKSKGNKQQAHAVLFCTKGVRDG